MTRELARNSECSTPVRPFYGQGGHVVFPAPSGLNGQTKRSERRPAGRARHAPAPGAGPQWAPRVLWGPNPKSARHAFGRRALKQLRSLLIALAPSYTLALVKRSRRPLRDGARRWCVVAVARSESGLDLGALVRSVLCWGLVQIR